ncbi:MAG: glycosyltransferase [Actinomycetes bacterium]
MSVSVALLVPAVNESSNIAATALVMREALDAGLVSRAVVLDGGSTDDTASIASSFGVEVLSVASLLPSLGAEVLGKGDSLFRGVHSVDADWYVFLDADLGNVCIDHVTAFTSMIGTPGVSFLKGGFVRVDEFGVPRDIPAGRVTELVGRPLLRRVHNSLAVFSQPLSGQVAIAGPLARSLTFATGYGVEVAMMIDVFRAVGLEGMLEADMGVINNRWKPEDALGEVTDQVLAGASLRVVTMSAHGLVTNHMVQNREPF